MASPLSQGLIARAIGESGAAFSTGGIALGSLEAAQKADEQFAKSIEAASLGAMRALPADQLLKSATKPGLRFSPVVDGYFMPEPVPSIYAEGKQAHVPLLAGWNKDEMGTPEKSKATVESFTQDATKNYGDRAEEFLKLYPAGNLDEAKASSAALAGDKFIAFATWKWIDEQAATGASPVYRYLFTHHLPAPADVGGAYHSADIEFAFDNLEHKDLKWRNEDKQLAKYMADYWTNFAKTGDPNGAGLPKWPVFKNAEGNKVMVLDVEPNAVAEQNRGRYEFLDQAAAHPANGTR